MSHLRHRGHWQFWFGADGQGQPYPLTSWQGVQTASDDEQRLVTLDLRAMEPAPRGVLALPVERLSSLQVLHVRSFQMTALPDELGEALITLDASYSSIEELPPSLSRLALLQTLELCGCAKLATLPDDLSPLTSLRRLLLASCVSLR